MKLDKAIQALNEHNLEAVREHLIQGHQLPDHFQSFALETWAGKDAPHDEQVNHAILQLASECGEVVKLWAKHLYKPAHEITREKVLDELGDLWYYVRLVSWLFGITTEELTQFNYEKLKSGHGWNDSGEKVKARNESGKWFWLYCFGCNMNCMHTLNQKTGKYRCPNCHTERDEPLITTG